MPVLLALHPRTRKILGQRPELRAALARRVWIAEPIGDLELMRVVSEVSLVLADDANVLVGADTAAIISASARGLASGAPSAGARKSFGDGRAAEKIVQLLG